MGDAASPQKVAVFTDPDCPFCVKLHRELKKLVTRNRDVTIYVKMFPLKMHPKAHDKARVILPITDPYVVHHGALGSFATVTMPIGPFGSLSVYTATTGCEFSVMQ